MSAVALRARATAEADQPRLFAAPEIELEAPPAAGKAPSVRDAPPAPLLREASSAPPMLLEGPPAPARTLDDLLSGTWTAVSAGEPAACPLCAGALRPRWSAGAGAVGGRCDDCGATLD